MLVHSWTGSSKSNSSRGTGETKSCCHTSRGQQFFFFAKHKLPTMSPLLMSEHVNGCVWIIIAVLKIGGLLPSSLKRSLQTKWWFIVSGFFLFPFYNLFLKNIQKYSFLGWGPVQVYFESDRNWNSAPRLWFIAGSACNSALRTFNGVDVMGNRLAEEVGTILWHLLLQGNH